MSLAAYATRLPLRQAPPEPLSACCAHPVPAHERPGERGCLRLIQCTRSGAPNGSFRALDRAVSRAPHEHPDRGHDARPAARLRALQNLPFGVTQLRRPPGLVDLDRAHAVASRIAARRDLRARIRRSRATRRSRSTMRPAPVSRSPGPPPRVRRRVPPAPPATARAAVERGSSLAVDDPTGRDPQQPIGLDVGRHRTGSGQERLTRGKVPHERARPARRRAR